MRFTGIALISEAARGVRRPGEERLIPDRRQGDAIPLVVARYVRRTAAHRAEQVGRFISARYRGFGATPRTAGTDSAPKTRRSGAMTNGREGDRKLPVGKESRAFRRET